QLQSLATQRLATNGHARDVATRTADTRDESEQHGITGRPDDDRNCARCFYCGAHRGSCIYNDHVDRDSHELHGKLRQRIDVPLGKTEIEDDGLAIDIAEIAKSLAESIEDGRRPVLSGRQDADARHFFRLLCRCRNDRGDRPYSRRAAEQRDERAPLHSITSSARSGNAGGMLNPSALAVLRLTTSSYFVGA